jgi:ABC-2 type transport system ATP-binding protein
MHEAATLADRVGVMDHGKLLALDTPEALLRTLPGSGTLELTTALPDPAVVAALVPALEALDGVERVEQLDAPPDETGSPQFQVRLYLAGESAAFVAPAATLLAQHRVVLRDVAIGTATLEDVFIHLTGRALR